MNNKQYKRAFAATDVPKLSKKMKLAVQSFIDSELDSESKRGYSQINNQKEPNVTILKKDPRYRLTVKPILINLDAEPYGTSIGMNVEDQWCSEWKQNQCVREFVQNLYDKCKQDVLQLDTDDKLQVSYKKTNYETKSKSEYNFFTSIGLELLARIAIIEPTKDQTNYQPDDAKVTILLENYNTNLDSNIFRIGKTSKNNELTTEQIKMYDKHSLEDNVGRFGEGTKVAINKLTSDDVNVSFYLNESRMSFSHCPVRHELMRKVEHYGAELGPVFRIILGDINKNAFSKSDYWFIAQLHDNIDKSTVSNVYRGSRLSGYDICWHYSKRGRIYYRSFYTNTNADIPFSINFLEKSSSVSRDRNYYADTRTILEKFYCSVDNIESDEFWNFYLESMIKDDPKYTRWQRSHESIDFVDYLDVDINKLFERFTKKFPGCAPVLRANESRKKVFQEPEDKSWKAVLVTIGITPKQHICVSAALYTMFQQASCFEQFHTKYRQIKNSVWSEYCPTEIFKAQTEYYSKQLMDKFNIIVDFVVHDIPENSIKEICLHTKFEHGPPDKCLITSQLLVNADHVHSLNEGNCIKNKNNECVCVLQYLVKFIWIELDLDEDYLIAHLTKSMINKTSTQGNEQVDESIDLSNEIVLDPTSIEVDVTNDTNLNQFSDDSNDHVPCKCKSIQCLEDKIKAQKLELELELLNQKRLREIYSDPSSIVDLQAIRSTNDHAEIFNRISDYLNNLQPVKRNNLKPGSNTGKCGLDDIKNIDKTVCGMQSMMDVYNSDILPKMKLSCQEMFDANRTLYSKMKDENSKLIACKNLLQKQISDQQEMIAKVDSI